MVKRIVSSILSVTLLTSCITFSSHETKVKAESKTTINSNSQITDKGRINTVANDNVTTSKIIEGTDAENEFEITLQVTTEEDIKNVNISPDAATVLVLDRSTSMNEKTSEGITRFQAMKTAANNFLTKFADVKVGSDAKRLVSIVSFATDVKNETYSNNGNQWFNVTNTNDLSTATSKVNTITNPSGWTNVEGALLMANNIVNDGKNSKVLEGIENVNIILLTDGCPTAYATNNERDSIKSMSGKTSGSFEHSEMSTWKPVGGTVNGVSANANNISKTIKDGGTNLYTIAFSTTPVDYYYENGKAKLNPSDWMATFADSNFLANNASELTEQFEKISKLIALSSDAWKVTDPMGENVIFKGVIDEGNKNVYSFDNESNTLTWDIKKSTPVESKTDGGNTKYTYTLKYKIALDTTKENFNYTNVSTNGETILDYYLFSKQGQDQSVELKHANFNIPKVKASFGNLSFKKVNEKKEARANVQFTLTGTATGSGKSVTMTAKSDENGNVSLTNIPAGVYTLTETAPNGYVAAGPWNVKVSYGKVTKDESLGDTIINYPTVRNISVEKKWTGLPEGQTELPESVTIRLYKNNEATDNTLVLTSNTKWAGAFNNLPYVDENGKVINYSVQEDKVNGYNLAISFDKNENKYLVTNSYNPEIIDIIGHKTWIDDFGDIHEFVPTIRITLQRTTADNWNDENAIEDVQTIELRSGELYYNFSNLPKTATNSKDYKYRVREAHVDGYATIYNDNFNITNKYTPESTSLKVNKEWINVDAYNDVLPTVRVILYQDGEEYRDQVLSSDNKFSFTFENLPKYEKSGVEYNYTVKEVMQEGTVGYSSSQVKNNDGSITITNTFDNTKISISGIKKWESVPAGEEVPSIKLHLYQNGVELTDKVLTLNGGVKQEGKEAYVFENLPKYSTEGKEYVYTVIEDSVHGYTSSGEGNSANNYEITNKFTPGTITVMGQKTWEGIKAQAKDKVPDITITLESLIDGEDWKSTGKTITLKEGKNTYKFEDLPKYCPNGNEYQYRVVESSVDGYTSSHNGSYNIINTYTPGETSVKVTKQWVNVDPNNNIVPEVKIVLNQNGKEIKSVILDNENNYTYTFEKLDKYAPTGELYVYTVVEVLAEGVEGYKNNIISGENGYIIENIFDSEATVDINFNKVWEGISKDSEVPSITLHLYQNGVELTDKVVTLKGGVKENGKESYVFENLPKYSTDGTEYVYTVQEDSINGYTSSGEATVSNNYTITNIYDGGEKVIITGKKTWVNVENINDVPDITIRVLRDGEEIHKIVVPSGTTTYEISADSMVKYAPDGHEYEYTLTEDKIDGYESERDGYNFTNTKVIKEEVSGISDIINTGDNNMMILYSALAILSLITMVSLRKRRKSI